MKKTLMGELELLKRQIRSGNNNKNFKTFSVETAGGKTTAAVEVFKKSTNKKEYIFVTKLREEAILLAKKINQDLDKKMAIVYIPNKKITDENEDTTRDIYELPKYNVVILTHAMYQNISNPTVEKQKEMRSIIEGFRTLVIDEEINPVKNSFYEFNETITIYGKLLGKYDRRVSSLFKDITQPLLDQFHIEYKPKNQLHRVREFEYDYKDIMEKCKYIKELISKIHDEWFEDRELEGYTEANKETMYKVLDKIIQTWDCIDNGVALVHPSLKAIYSYDYNFKYLMLKNNIWLDASACFNTMYRNDLFNMVFTERKIDHSNCKVKFSRMNTSSSAKNKDKDFRDMISTYINDNANTKSLVLGKKIENTQLKEKYLADNNNVEFLNFENMRGINDYREFNQCFYIHTYRLPVAYYVFLNDYFNRTITSDSEMEVGVKYSSWGFKNKILNDLMITDMASSMYQGLKRVERNRNPHAIYHIFTDESEVLLITLKQMKGIIKKELLETVKKPLTNKEKIIKFIDEEWDKKRIMCKDVRELLGISEGNWKKAWNDKDFISEMKKKRIKTGLIKGNKKILYLMKY